VFNVLIDITDTQDNEPPYLHSMAEKVDKVDQADLTEMISKNSTGSMKKGGWVKLG